MGHEPTIYCLRTDAALPTELPRQLRTVRPKSKQGSTTNLNISSSVENEKELLRWDLNPRYTAYEDDALPTELPRQLRTVRPKSKQGSTTNLNISSSMENEKELLRWDLNPRYTAYEDAALPTELPRQLRTVRPKSKQGSTTNLNISSSMENEKRAAQVGHEPTIYCLRGRCSTYN